MKKIVGNCDAIELGLPSREQFHASASAPDVGITLQAARPKLVPVTRGEGLGPNKRTSKPVRKVADMHRQTICFNCNQALGCPI